MKQIEFSQTMKNIFTAIQEASGNTFLIGGAVRDAIMNRSVHDFDFEVHNIKPDVLQNILSRFGSVTLAGERFAVFHFRAEGEIEMQFSLPRTERAIGTKRQDFEITVDPDMGIAKASKRRDFRFNTIAMNVITGEVFDPNNGIEDIKDRFIVPTTPEVFNEDAGRVIRACRFASTLNMRFKDETIKHLTKPIREIVNSLPHEFIWSEWVKWATKSIDPTKMPMLLNELQVIMPFTFDWMFKTPQSKKHHPEGNVGIHSMMVLKQANGIRKRENLNEFDSICLMQAALWHDVGKVNTTVIEADGSIHSHGHEDDSAEQVEIILKHFGANKEVISVVSKLVKNHMRLFGFSMQMSEKTKQKFVRNLSNEVAPANLKLLLFLIEADHRGRSIAFTGKDLAKIKEIDKIANNLDVINNAPKPILMGRHLIESGLKPSIVFKEILNIAFKSQIDGDFDNLENGLIWLNDYIKKYK